MSSWKQSFESVSQELELAKKKKQALDELLSAGRVSQPTYDHLEQGLAETILDLEAQQRSLVDNMTDRADELEKQAELFESFLASLEIHHAAQEVNEETYVKQKETITLGIAATQNELGQIRGSLTKIGPQ